MRAWKAYLSHLNEPEPPDPQARPVYYGRRDEFFTQLLYEMGSALGYDFDKTQISKDGYVTVYHSHAQEDADLIRRQLARVSGPATAQIPMSVVSFPAGQAVLDAQAAYFKMVTDLVTQGKPLPVVIVPAGDKAKEQTA